MFQLCLKYNLSSNYYLKTKCDLLNVSVYIKHYILLLLIYKIPM